ncbi:MAG: hypothetical protein JNJ48_01570 [Phycisphaerae bacterium]|nr:hypothetical protein [Phycisphaerae bacterium]
MPITAAPTLNRAAALALAAACAACCGCSQNAAIIEGPQYPETRQSATLDVHVLRDETRISLTNTTANAIPACRMWLNQWYSRDFPGLGVGQTVTIDLSEYKDQYGRAFRAGGFFATERAEWLVQAQLEIDGRVIGLVVVSP